MSVCIGVVCVLLAVAAVLQNVHLIKNKFHFRKMESCHVIAQHVVDEIYGNSEFSESHRKEGKCNFINRVNRQQKMIQNTSNAGY